MLAIPSRVSDRGRVSQSGTLTMIHQILFILCIDVKDKMGKREQRSLTLTQPDIPQSVANRRSRWRTRFCCPAEIAALHS